MIYFQEIRQIQKDHWLMLVTLFLMKAGQFMSLPFLAIYLVKNLSSSPSIISFVIGVGGFTYGVSGLVAGMLVDRIGIKKSLILALLLGGGALFSFFSIHNVTWYILMSILIGIGRAVFNVGSKAYGVTKTTHEQRRFTFRLRSMCTDSAAALGPLLGAYFATHNYFMVFKIIGIIYGILALISLFMLENTLHHTTMKPISFLDALGVLYQDRKLQLLLIITCLYWMIWTQLESTLPQYLTMSLRNGVHIYAWMLIINAIGCASLQLFIAHLTRNFKDRVMCFWGMMFFATSYLIIAFSLSIPFLFIACIGAILSQVIIFPLNDLFISKIAPVHRMGTYYGIITIAAIGMGVGPILGGLIYQHLGARINFIFFSGIALVCIVLYRKLFNQIELIGDRQW